MYYNLITNREDLEFNTVKIADESWLYAGINALSRCDSIAIDIETSGLNPWTDEIFLIALYNPKFDWCLIVDTQTVDILVLKDLIESKLILAHNVQFEASFLGVKGIHIKRTYDTMIAEAKLTQGSNFSVALIHTLTRRKMSIPFGMDKDVIQDFISGDFHLEEKHIIYNASDVLALHALKTAQEVHINSFKLGYFINSIHNPLALVLNRIKLEGFVFNSDKWITEAKKIEEICIQHANSLNDKVMHLVDWQNINSDVARAKESKEKGIIRTTERLLKLNATKHRLISQGKTHLKSFDTTIEGIMKAEEALKEYEAVVFDNKIGINWSSSKQVLATFEELGMKPLPTSKSATTHRMQPSISHAARDAWLLDNPEHELKPIMEIFHELKNKLHLVKSFGEAWVEKYVNPVTGRVHTSFRQDAATGRLTSGNANEGLFNSQQIPANNEYRHCFGVEEGYAVATIDYSGAELCFMAVTAEDDRLIELSKGDMHSYFANKGWEAIYASRNIPWFEADIISSSRHKDKRTGYKPMMFGVVYGLRDKKAAETLNITVKEGAIAINTIKKEIPKTIAMVEAASEFAINNGYVVHNTRTNSRRWFMDAYAAIQLDKEMPFMVKATVESTARNTRIQGSQADMIMEAIVTIDRWLNIYKIDAMIIGTVHDEIIYKFNKKLTWFPERVQEFMERIAALYMKGMLKLRADLEVMDTWTK